MELKIYNTLNQTKETFVPLDPHHVKMYTCGPTVYNLLHVGNFRVPVVFNMVRNWLEFLGYKVTYVSNFTDVDDKIIRRAQDENCSSHEVSEKYIQEYKKDYEKLGLKAQSLNPKVTENIESIVSMVQKLIQNEKAYVVDNEVFYSVLSFAEYGKLSHRNPEDMKSGARVEIDEKKQNPLDFTLWKPAKPGEPSWPSPWGQGRPGWHIECSAMIQNLLGETIDIHGGGMDLIFPHHENEIAQSEGCHHTTFVKYWMHNNMINFGNQKMSKSLGNIITARDFMNKYHPEILKYLLLQVHYRSPSDLSDEQVNNAISGLARVYSALALAQSMIDSPEESTSIDAEYSQLLSNAQSKVADAFNDDFNTPEVFASIFSVIRDFNSQFKLGMKIKPQQKARAIHFKQWIQNVGNIMSLYQEPAQKFLKTLDDMLLNIKNLKREDIEKLIAERNQVRSQKNYKKSDEIRNQLTSMGIALQDTPQGTYWEVSK